MAVEHPSSLPTLFLYSELNTVDLIQEYTTPGQMLGYLFLPPNSIGGLSRNADLSSRRCRYPRPI